MDKQQVRDQGKRRAILNGVLALAVFAMMVSILGAGQPAQGADLGLLGDTTFNVIVQTGPSAPLQGVLVEVTTASGGVQTSVITDSTGSAVMHVPDTFVGVTTPYKTAYEFTPVNANVSFPNPSISDIVFTAAASTRLVNVSGTISVGTGLLGAGTVAGVTVTIAGDGVPTAQAVTNASGIYSFDLPINATNVTLTPSLAGYAFTPPSALLPPAGSAMTQNFTATPAAITLVTISGNVSLPNPSTSDIVLKGVSAGTVVTLTATGSETTSTQIVGSGAYSLSVSSGFTGVVTPSAAGLTFTPASRSYASITVNQTAQDYVASAGPEPGVFKKIEGNVRGVTGTTVTITVTDTTGTALLTVETTGTYSVSVATPFSGYVKANAEGYNFLPFRRAYENLMVDLLRNVKPQDFDAVPLSKTGLTDVYDIVYKKSGKGKPVALDGTAGIKISSGSIIIAGDSEKDTLSIKINKATKKNPTVLANLPAIASIQTSQGLAVLLSEARVDTLSVKGRLGKITTTNASIGKIKTAGSIGAIAMTDNKPSPTEVITAIVADSSSPKKASVKLMGIKLEVLVTPETQAFTLVQLETKKSKVVGSRPAQFIVAESGFLGGAGSSFDVKSPYDLQAGVVNSIVAKGSMVQPTIMVAGIKKVAGTGLALNGKTFPADISVGLLYAKGQNLVVSAAGGNIEPGFYLADGKITSFNATAKKLNGVFTGGLIGDPTTTTASIAPTSNALLASGLVVACSGLNPPNPAAKTAKDMGTINGSVGVFGLFVAGGTPTMAGGIPIKVTPQSASSKIGAVKTSKTGKGLVRLYGTAPKKIVPAITVKLGDAN